MNPHSPAQQLLVELEAATTERQFASALADYRAPRDERLSKRVQRKWMQSLRQLEDCRDLPGRNNICRWESGDELKFVSFTEQQLRAYLRLCKITGELFEACIRHYRRIAQKSAIDQDDKDLIYRLKSLFNEAGRPSFWELEKLAEGRLSLLSIMDLYTNMFSRYPYKPLWREVKGFVLACGVPEAELEGWHKAWEQYSSPWE